VQAKVEQYARQWEQYANINFQFVDGKNAVIRISFEQDGSWSALGTDALVEEYFPKNEPTMNYGWLTPNSEEDDYSSVVLHEFGHALGMIHEHTSPVNGIQWNKEAVYESLSGPPNRWDKETIDFNMFERYTITQTQFTEFDPHSIMLYSFPKEWTLNGMSFPVNTVLSEKDKKFISARYPKTT
jgi:Matrixin